MVCLFLYSSRDDGPRAFPRAPVLAALGSLDLSVGEGLGLLMTVMKIVVARENRKQPKALVANPVIANSSKKKPPVLRFHARK